MSPKVGQILHVLCISYHQRHCNDIKKLNIQVLKAVVLSVIATILVSNECDLFGQLQESRPILRASAESVCHTQFLGAEWKNPNAE